MVAVAFRKSSLGLALVIIALAWRIGIHLTCESETWVAALIGLGGVLLFALTVKASWLHRSWTRDVMRDVSQIAVLACVSLILGIISGGYCRVFFLGFCGLNMLMPVLKRQNSNLVGGLWAGFFIAAVCAVSSHLLLRLGWCFHDIALPSWANVVARLFPNTSVSDGFLNIWTRQGPRNVRITFEALGLYEVWFLSASFVAFSVFLKAKHALRWLALSFAIAVFYALIRFLAIAVTAIEIDLPRLLWDSNVSFVTWLPMGLMLGSALPHQNQVKLRFFSRVSSRFPLALVMALALGMALAFNDPGRLKSGRVVIDETHANWEWTDIPFDTTSVGIHAEYNYRCLYDYIARHYKVARCTSGLTPSLLDTTDIVIIKTPTEPYGEDEINAIVEFVKNGGGLILIGDHTNLFGMSAYLNEIARQFGMRFRYDDTFDVATTSLTVFTPDRIAYHPSVRKVEEFSFLTSCSIDADPFVEPVMVGSGLGSEDVDYSHPNFFGNITFDLSDRFGLFLQAAARKFGEGRVLLFTDSTCFSNFCMFSDGKAEFVSGFLDYLNRKGKRFGCIPLLVGLASFSGLLLLMASKSLKTLSLLTGLLCLLVGIHLGSELSSALYGRLTILDPGRTVLFDTNHSRAGFFDYFGLSDERTSADYTEFFISTQRIGFQPVATHLARLKQLAPAAVVVVEPSKHFSQDEIDMVKSYVKDGGRLLVLDSILNGTSTADELLGNFGMSLKLGFRTSRDSCNHILIQPVLNVIGGFDAPGDMDSSIRYSRLGEGYAMVSVDSFCLTGRVLGRLLRGRLDPFILKRYLDASRLLRVALCENP